MIFEADLRLLIKTLHGYVETLGGFFGEENFLDFPVEVVLTCPSDIGVEHDDLDRIIAHIDSVIVALCQHACVLIKLHLLLARRLDLLLQEIQWLVSLRHR